MSVARHSSAKRREFTDFRLQWVEENPTNIDTLWGRSSREVLGTDLKRKSSKINRSQVSWLGRSEDINYKSSSSSLNWLRGEMLLVKTPKKISTFFISAQYNDDSVLRQKNLNQFQSFNFSGSNSYDIIVYLNWFSIIDCLISRLYSLGLRWILR